MEGIKKGILKGFLELDEKLRKIPEVASGEDKSGTTAVCALISQVNICKKIIKKIMKNNITEIPDHCQLWGQQEPGVHRRQACTRHSGQSQETQLRFERLS